MTTDLTGRLRADMARFTRDVRVPPGLAVKAYRHGRRRRIRVAIAAGTTAALAASAVTAAGVTGAFVSDATKPIQTTAYIVKKMEGALAPAKADGLITYIRTTFSPADRFEPNFGNAHRFGPGSTVAVTVSWQYGKTERISNYGADGQDVFDVRSLSTICSMTETVVDYNDRTWWTTGNMLLDPPHLSKSACQQPAADGGWPTSIRQYLSADNLKLVGRQVVDGVDAFKLTRAMKLPNGGPSAITLWVNPVTFLPVRFDSLGQQQLDYRFLSATPANLARLDEPIPAGFRQVPPN
jgi:hypothetical protein